MPKIKHYKKESDFQSDLIKQIKKDLPESIVLKNDPEYKQGIPDLLIANGNKYAFLEVKKSKDDNLRTGRFSSAAAICSRRNNKVRPQRSGKASEKHPNISLFGCVYCCPG